MITLGIDPGKDGALACMVDGEPTEWLLMPSDSGKGGHIRWREIAEWIENLPGKPDLAVLEKVQAMPGGGKRKMGATSAFSFGGAYYGAHAVLQLLEVPYVTMTPQKWKKLVLAGFDTKDKASSVRYVQQRFPGVDLTPTLRARKPHDGIGDAICMAEAAAIHLKARR